MRIAVAGGTGVVGRHTVRAAESAGHDVTVLSRRRGVDVLDEAALAAALQDIDVVIDTLNVTTTRRGPAEEFFTGTSRRLGAAAAASGVSHLVTLSILGIDAASGYGYYQAKLAQERVVTSGSVPATILRAAQFHEFLAQVLSITRKGPIALMPRMRSQPVAARTVGEHLVRAAEARPGGIVGLAGPGVHEMPDLARRLLGWRRVRAVVVAVPIPGSGGRAIRRGALLATPDTTIDGPTFDEWLAGEDAAAVPF